MWKNPASKTLIPWKSSLVAVAAVKGLKPGSTVVLLLTRRHHLDAKKFKAAAMWLVNQGGCYGSKWSKKNYEGTLSYRRQRIASTRPRALMNANDSKPSGTGINRRAFLGGVAAAGALPLVYSAGFGGAALAAEPGGPEPLKNTQTFPGVISRQKNPDNLEFRSRPSTALSRRTNNFTPHALRGAGTPMPKTGG